MNLNAAQIIEPNWNFVTVRYTEWEFSVILVSLESRSHLHSFPICKWQLLASCCWKQWQTVSSSSELFHQEIHINASISFLFSSAPLGALAQKISRRFSDDSSSAAAMGGHVLIVALCRWTTRKSVSFIRFSHSFRRRQVSNHHSSHSLPRVLRTNVTDGKRKMFRNQFFSDFRR
jgi:hypothetical protein